MKTKKLLLSLLIGLLTIVFTTLFVVCIDLLNAVIAQNSNDLTFFWGSTIFLTLALVLLPMLLYFLIEAILDINIIKQLKQLIASIKIKTLINYSLIFAPIVMLITAIIVNAVKHGTIVYLLLI